MGKWPTILWHQFNPCSFRPSSSLHTNFYGSSFQRDLIDLLTYWTIIVLMFSKFWRQASDRYLFRNLFNLCSFRSFSVPNLIIFLIFLHPPVGVTGRNDAKYVARKLISPISMKASVISSIERLRGRLPYLYPLPVLLYARTAGWSGAILSNTHIWYVLHWLSPPLASRPKFYVTVSYSVMPGLVRRLP